MTMDLFDDINKTISDSDLCKAFMNNPFDDGKIDTGEKIYLNICPISDKNVQKLAKTTSVIETFKKFPKFNQNDDYVYLKENGEIGTLSEKELVELIRKYGLNHKNNCLHSIIAVSEGGVQTLIQNGFSDELVQKIERNLGNCWILFADDMTTSYLEKDFPNQTESNILGVYQTLKEVRGAYLKGRKRFLNDCSNSEKDEVKETHSSIQIERYGGRSWYTDILYYAPGKMSDK